MCLFRHLLADAWGTWPVLCHTLDVSAVALLNGTLKCMAPGICQDRSMSCTEKYSALLQQMDSLRVDSFTLHCLWNSNS